MKKLLVLLLVLLMCFTFVSCGDDSPATNEGDSSETTEEAAEEATEEPAAFEEIVLFDTDEATMKIVGFDPEDFWGFKLDVFLENKTDKTLMFSAEDVSVNGFMIDPLWATEVAGGKKENTDISWLSSELETNGIESVETIEMKVSVYDSDNWSDDYLIDEVYTINIPK